MYTNQEAVLENQTRKIHWNFDIQIDQLILLESKSSDNKKSKRERDD